MIDFNVGDKIWVLNSFGIRHILSICRVLEISEWEVKVELLDKNNIARIFFINQPNIKFFKDKKIARLVFIARSCKKKNLVDEFDNICEIIKVNTGLTNKENIKKEIALSQSQFPELWI